ncbi:MAG TPA: hypothetical protein VNR89_04105 [Roseomonas sp.]|nr:hypothetical protein [Roseomonas sp.]
MNPRFSRTNVSFSSGASTSGAFAVENRVLLSILMPSAWDAAALTLQASADGAAWFNVFDQSGMEVSIQASAGRLILLDIRLPLGLPLVRFRSGTSAAPVVQSAARTLVVSSREFD